MSIINDTIEPSRTTKCDTEFNTTIKRWPNGRTTGRREWTTEKNTFEVEFDGISLAEYQALKAFFRAQSGSFGVFTFIDRHENVSYQVRFGDDTLSRQMVKANSRGLYKIKLKLVED